jgi:hypothetical protein
MSSGSQILVALHTVHVPAHSGPTSINATPTHAVGDNRAVTLS